MRVSISIGLFILVIILSVRCSENNEKIAERKFELASQLFEAKSYQLAKLTLDTFFVASEGNASMTLKGHDLLKKISIEEQTNNLQFLDSLLKVKVLELEQLMKNFVTSQEYGSDPILIHKRQNTTNSYSRSFIRANLNLLGDFYISSHYTGTSYIHHNQIKVYYGDQSISTEVILEDGFNNRDFEAGGLKWEIVRYKDGLDNGVVDFISRNYNKPIKAQFVGKSSIYIVLESYDKEAIRDAYEISFLLKEKTKIVQQIANVKRELLKLNS